MNVALPEMKELRVHFIMALSEWTGHEVCTCILSKQLHFFISTHVLDVGSVWALKMK